MANDATSYKLAFYNSLADYRAAKKECGDAGAAWDKNPTPENALRVKNAIEAADAAAQRYTNAGIEYRVYTDRKMLPESMGEDKIKEAIMQDPDIQKQERFANRINERINHYNAEAQRETGDPTVKVGETIDIKSVDEVYSKQTAEENKDQPNSSFLSGVANTATGAVNNAVNGVTGAVNGVINSAVNTVTGIKDTVSGMVSNVVGGVVNTADKLAGIAGGVKDKIAGLFSSDSKKDAQTKALADAKANKGQKETATKVTEISPDQHAAMQQSVAVVTKPVTEVTTNTKSAPVDQKKEELPKDGPLSKVGEKIKATTGKVASMTDAVKSVTNEISANVRKATSVVNGVKSKITETVNSVKSVVSETVGTVKNTVKGAIDTVRTAANEVVGTAAGIVSSVTQGITSFTNPIVGTITDTISAGKALTDELASSLPGPLGQFVSAKNAAFFNKITNKVANNKLMKVNAALNSLNGLATSDKLTNAVGTVLLKHVGKKYANITDSTGLSLSHVFGDNDKDVISKYYDQLVRLCPDLTMPENIVDYGNNKTLFDALLNLLAGSGASDLLGQLISCPASNSLYFDDSSVKVLQDAALTARQNGDVATYYTILGKLGRENMPNIREDLVVINANNDKDNAAETAPIYRDICTKGGVTFENLLCAQPASNISAAVEPTRRSSLTKMYDGPMVQLSCVGNTYITDQIMGADMRKLVQASIYLNH